VRTDFVHADDAKVEGVLTGHRRAAGHRAVVEVHGVVRREVDRVPRVVTAGGRPSTSGGDTVDHHTADVRSNFAAHGTPLMGKHAALEGRPGRHVTLIGQAVRLNVVRKLSCHQATHLYPSSVEPPLSAANRAV